MRWLLRHDGAPCVVDGEPRAARRAAWLTGQSSWRHSALSAGQQRVLDDLAADGWAAVRLGFPWTTTAHPGPGDVRRPALPVASVRNAAQHLAARPGGVLAHQVARHLQPLLDATDERLLLLCGSTGAQMLGVAAPLLRVPDALVVQVVALGPVGRPPAPGGAWDVRVVRGDRDRISRWGYRGPVDVHVPGGHLDAATGPAASAAVRRIAADGAVVGRVAVDGAVVGRVAVDDPVVGAVADDATTVSQVATDTPVVRP